MLALAVRNVLRHKARTALTLAAIIFGVVGLLLSGGFVHDMFGQLAEAIVHSQTGHIQIAKRGFFEKGTRSPEKYLVERPAELEETVRAMPQVVEAMGRLHFSGLLNNGRTDHSIIGEGIEPAKEARLGTRLRLAAGRALEDEDGYGVLLGEGVAHSLNLSPGDRANVVVSTADGAMNTLDFEVVGVFQSFSKEYDARAIKIPLAAAQELLNTAGVNVMVIALHRTSGTRSAVAALQRTFPGDALEVRAWNELNDFYDKTVDLYDRQFGVLRLIILAMVLLSVVNSVNMSLFERVGEFGTMRALGNRGRDLFALVLTEGAVLGLAGALLGTLLGIVLAVAISAVGIPMPPPPNANLGYTARILLVPSVVGSAFLVGFVATVLGAVLPALRVSRMPVVEALRQNT